MGVLAQLWESSGILFFLGYFFSICLYLTFWVSDLLNKPWLPASVSEPLKYVFPSSIDVAGPYTIENGPLAVFLNVVLFFAFSFHHSFFLQVVIAEMVKKIFKGFSNLIGTTLNPALFYPLVATNLLHLLITLWQPNLAIAWEVQSDLIRVGLEALQIAGSIGFFLLCFVPSIGPMTAGLKSDGLYQYCRHPMYMCFLIMFWSSPRMTSGHLLFALLATIYIFVGSTLEERKLVKVYGDQYLAYQNQVFWFPPVINEDNSPKTRLCIVFSLVFLYWLYPGLFSTIICSFNNVFLKPNHA